MGGVKKPGGPGNLCLLASIHVGRLLIGHMTDRVSTLYRVTLGQCDGAIDYINHFLVWCTTSPNLRMKSISSSPGWFASLPIVRLEFVPQAGHLPFVESPELHFPSFERFLNRRSPEAAGVGGRDD